MGTINKRINFSVVIINSFNKCPKTKATSIREMLGRLTVCLPKQARLKKAATACLRVFLAK